MTYHLNVKMNCILSLFYKRIENIIFSSENDTVTCNAATFGNAAPIYSMFGFASINNTVMCGCSYFIALVTGTLMLHY